MTRQMRRLPAPDDPLPTGQDFYELRREAIGLIAEMAGDTWTDYNAHDPGITIVEAVSYAVTELVWRMQLPIADILQSGSTARGADPYPGQPFFTARSVLTINPTTTDDFRRLLIDLEDVRNAWVRARECACDVPLYAWCEDRQLTLSYQPAQRKYPDTELIEVRPRGLYDIALELEDDDDLGNLNDRKLVIQELVFDDDGRPHPLTVEVRFPAWEPTDRGGRQIFVYGDDISAAVASVLSLTKSPSIDVGDQGLQRHWQRVFYMSFDVTVGADTVRIEHAAVRVFGDQFTRSTTTTNLVRTLIAEHGPTGTLSRYRAKLRIIDRAVAHAKTFLVQHRNLDEDYCRVQTVTVTDIAVCADVEIHPDVDIELVQANIWFEIEQYLNPPVRFHFLDDLLDEGVPVETIFNGPALRSGFIVSDDLAEAKLRSSVRVSDIINRLMEISGVIAVHNLQLTAYDQEGIAHVGLADPSWDDDGTAHFDPARVSASWLLVLPEGQQPRLYHRMSRFLFSGNGLPLLPRTDEAVDALMQLRGAASRPKLHQGADDLLAPAGDARDLDTYFPVQHSLPQTYGIGGTGLPAAAPPLRRAQARQLKAYLLVFDQLLRNAHTQLARTADLFSLLPQEATYFTKVFSNREIDGLDDLADGLDQDALDNLAETAPEFVDRRNRFLDHVLARFGEQFSEYALLMANLHGEAAAKRDLIEDKTAFLNAYPQLSHDRGRAFNRTVPPGWPGNLSGLQHRVHFLLGCPDHRLVWSAHSTDAVPGYTQDLLLRNRSGAELLRFTVPDSLTAALAAVVAAGSLVEAGHKFQIVVEDSGLQLFTRTPDDDTSTARSLHDVVGDTAHVLVDAIGTAFRSIVAELTVPDQYRIAPAGLGVSPGLQVTNGQGDVVGECGDGFDTATAAEAYREELLAWGAQERAIIVEHLLLRPKFPGDALYPVNADDACSTCGDEDPYSFRLTFVIPGWTTQLNTDMRLREFAERTIQKETPSHLIMKICWVGNDDFAADPCDPIVDEIAEIIERHWAAIVDEPPNRTDICVCASAVLAAFRSVFESWYETQALEHHQHDSVQLALRAALAAVDLNAVGCAAQIDDELRSALHDLATEFFAEIVLRGRQFDRLEAAWWKWLDADSTIDWTEERLAETLTAFLATRVDGSGSVTSDQLCGCAAVLLADFGTGFARWRDNNISAGLALGDFSDFVPTPVTLCPDIAFSAGTADAVSDLLTDRYLRYTEVSYRLRVLLDTLSELRNTYPSGTLHDCSESGSRNPIRLGQTALGSNV